jgi:hypothetical protein
MKLNDKKIALDRFMRDVMEEGQRQMMEINVEARSVWGEIAKNNPDMQLKTQDWVPSGADKNVIVLIQQRFSPEG